jgi:hypothetical protein
VECSKQTSGDDDPDQQSCDGGIGISISDLVVWVGISAGHIVSSHSRENQGEIIQERRTVTRCPIGTSVIESDDDQY